MALQDLTPQLRTRLSRMERAVGWFVVLAMLLLGFGFAYYIYNTAARKGWFKIKAPYFTFVSNANGLKVGDPVKLMGFDAGEITVITAQPADDFTYNVYVEFELKQPFYDYMWTEGSRARIASADLLGKRVLEVSKGTGGYPAYVFFPLQTNVSIAHAQTLPERTNWVLAQEVFDQTGTNRLADALWPLTDTNLNTIAAAGYTHIDVLDQDPHKKRSRITAVWNQHEARYDEFRRNKPKSNLYWLLADESPPVTDRLEKVVDQVEKALPGFFSLTNQLVGVLSNSTSLASNLNVIALSARPAVSNLAAATAHLDQPGALGEWLLPTNLNRQLETTLGSASAAMTSANTNLAALAENLGRSLDHLASLTSNLNSQVEANTNLVSAVSQTIVHADEFVQGLKRHWLLRSAFRTKSTNAPPAAPPAPLLSPKAKGER